MTFKRRVLSALSKPELLELGRQFELEVTTRMSVDQLADALAKSKKAKLDKIVTTALSRDTLKEMCAACGLAADGKEKQPLVDRILAAANGDGDDGNGKSLPQTPLALAAIDEAAVAAARASVAPAPRASRQASRAAEGSVDADGAAVLSYRYDHRRKNNPEVGMVNPDTDPVQPKTKWAYDPHIDPALQFDVGRSQVELLIDNALASGEVEAMRAALSQLKRQAEPYLAWTGKAERTSFEIDTVSLHVHERVDPASILAAVRKGWKKAKSSASSSGGATSYQLGLFSAPFENLPLRDAIDFYKHDKGWSNRLIAGDSLLVMNSLLQKESMAGQVQMVYIDPPYGIKYGSNFQPFVGNREVKDRKDKDLTQEPEMIKAFRDTWEIGIHSYLTYLRDRLVLARDLLHESGSVFVQISDENVHHVREILDDVFGADNFCSLITVKKTGGQTSELLPRVADYLVWYCKNHKVVKYRQLYIPKEHGVGEGSGARYDQVEMPNGLRRTMTKDERRDESLLPPGSRPYQLTSLKSSGFRENTTVDYDFQGKTYHPGSNSNWKTTVKGLERLSRARRIAERTETVAYVRFLKDFEAYPVTAIWDDVAGAADKIYVVQTSHSIVERCVLMTTDPGDLVLDPTCGSGTTAFVAEKWGRRWITCDTSRVAVTLTKKRLMTAGYDYYELKYPHEGVRGGFVYQTMPHVTLKSIGTNADIDQIWDRSRASIAGTLGALNAELAKAPKGSVMDIDQGARAGESLEIRKLVPLLEYEVPVEWSDSLPASARSAFDAFNTERLAVQAQMDAAIAAQAEQEILYDDPRVSGDKLRITGPFTVEAVPFPTVFALEEGRSTVEADVAIARSGESSRQHQWRDELLKTGIRGKGGQMLKLASLETLPDLRYIHGSGTLADSGERVVVSFGPEHGALEQRQVEMAMREAGDLFPRPKMIVYCAFAFDPEAAKDIDQTKGIVALKVQMNTDLLTEDLKKARSSNQSFWLMGQPDVELRKRGDGLLEVEVRGFDYFDTTKGELVSGGKSKIAMWSLDPDYDERSLFPRQIFFPMAGKKDGWNRLQRDIRAELDEDRLRGYHGTVSLPFETGENKKVAVKVVDDRGIESLKILPLD